MIGLTVDGKNILRAYSVVSPPWSEELEFLSIKIPDGALTSQLQHIKVGDEIVIAPKSTGTLRNDAVLKGGELWLLSTGTGLAPFMSLIRDLKTLETCCQLMWYGTRSCCAATWSLTNRLLSGANSMV